MAINFFDLTLPDLEKLLTGQGKERYRAQQLYSWVYRKGVCDFEQMTNLSKKFRVELPGLFEFSQLKVVERKISQDGTQKFLFETHDKKTVESVLIPNEDRLTLCISSEIGCNLGCKFCFSGKQKLERKLTVAEIVGQYLGTRDSLPEEQEITNIVFMGMGEPLDNPDPVFSAIDVLHSEWGLNFSRRKVTISTAGMINLFPRIAQERVRLAVSLNATTDELRNHLMPINKKYPIAKLMQACRSYYKQSKDRVTMGYVLLKGLNDSPDDARRLIKIGRSVPCKLNLIPFNEHDGTDFQRPDDETVLRFQKTLMDAGVHVLLRRTMGRDIYAACGQLRSKYEGRPESLKVKTP